MLLQGQRSLTMHTGLAKEGSTGKSNVVGAKVMRDG